MRLKMVWGQNRRDVKRPGRSAIAAGAFAYGYTKAARRSIKTPRECQLPIDALRVPIHNEAMRKTDAKGNHHGS